MKPFKFTILLSASVPDPKRDPKYQKIHKAQIQIEEAIIGLSRNIFQNGGKIIFGGHPSISPLVATVATEFPIPQLDKGVEDRDRLDKAFKHINIYQSRAYEDVIPKQTSNLFNLGYSEIIWTEAQNGEKFNPEIKGQVQCQNSLEKMRREMISEDIDALVCIGGMEGVEIEFNLFREIQPNKPIYILQTTGGASAILAEKFSFEDQIIVPDKNFDANRLKKEESKIDIIPFSFYTAQIIDEIIKGL